MLREQRRRSKTVWLLRLILLCYCTGVMMLVGCRSRSTSVPPDAASKSSETILQIAPGASERRQLTGGAKEVFGVTISQEQLLRFSIDKGDLLLATTLYGPGGDKLLEHVSQDFEIVELAFPAQRAGTYTIELRSQESTQAPRQYELKVQPLTPVTELNLKDSEARQAMARAEMLRAQSIAASFREAAQQFDKAALIWTSVSDFANAAQATLKSGDVYFFLSDYPEASKRYANAEALAAKTSDWLLKARALSQMGRSQSFVGNNDLAQSQLTQALNLFRQHEAERNAIATNAYGETLTNLAEVSYSKGNFGKSSDQVEAALKIFQHYRKGEARAHLLLAQITGSLGEPDRAVAELTKARDLYQSINDKNGETLAGTTLELVHSGEGHENRAVEVHLKALDVFRSTGDRLSEATTLNMLGQSYQQIPEYQIAISYYQQALQLSETIGSVDGMTSTELQLATIYDKSQQPDQALEHYERCLSLARSAGNARDEINAVKELARFNATENLHTRAAELFQKALKFYQSIGDLRGQAMGLNAYGDFLLKQDKKPDALESYRQALTFSEKVGEPSLLLDTLKNLARVNLELGSLDAALSFIQRSLKMIEGVRANVESPEFRVSYFAGVQAHYELCIRILMQLEKLRPGQGFATEALAVSERGRARLLVDLVTEARSLPRTGVGNELLERERKFRGLLRAQAEYQMNLLPNQKAEFGEAEAELVQLRAQYQAVLAELSREQPRLFSPQQAPPLDLQRIQHDVLGSDTMLLEYSLGENASYLWVVTSDSLKFYELPDRKTVEDAALEYLELMTARQRTVQQNAKGYQAGVEAADKLLLEKAKELSELLLGPLAGQLGTKRLLIVPEGALHYVAFDALPLPGSKDGNVLLEVSEVIRLPSMSTLVAIRGEQNRSSSPEKLVAIIADPVFGSDDDRVQLKANSSDANQLNRLIHASEEADAISAVAPWRTTMVAKGFAASRETAMSYDLGQYQILHFATHAFPDNEHPELSSIVLTMVDRNGGKVDGLISLHDIYNMDLSAELTVLSACQTALGKDTKGEGLVGLTHGFISAGSKSVVASLWKVDDGATAVLMADFYEAMLQQGMSPAAALRASKLKMMRNKQWSAPYYWAGFVVQGEYENHITVDRRSPLRFVLILLFLLGLVTAGLVIVQKRKRRIAALKSS